MASAADVMGWNGRDTTDREAGIAMQGKDSRDARQSSRRDRVDRSAGHDFLGSLKDQAHADRQLGSRRHRQAAPNKIAVCASWPHA